MQSKLKICIFVQTINIRCMWKEFINGYSVSDEGEIRNDKTGRILKIEKNNRGFYRVTIGGKHYFVHILVAKAFVRNPKGYSNVIFKDLDKENITSENLQWMMNINNYTQQYAIERRMKNIKVSEKLVKLIQHKPYLSVKTLTMIHNISPSTIYAIRKGKNIKRLDGSLDA